MKRLAMLLFLVALSGGQLFSDEPKVEGWKAAKFGMTEAEVRDAFKDEIREFQKPEKWKNGSAPIYVEFQLAEKPWDARFIFDVKAKTLVEVLLRPSKTVGFPGLLFPDLERQLTEKYGQPESKNDERTGVGRLRSWKRAQTRIELRYSEIEGLGVRNLTISYSRIPAGGSDNL